MSMMLCICIWKECLSGDDELLWLSFGCEVASDTFQ